MFSSDPHAMPPGPDPAAKPGPGRAGPAHCAPALSSLSTWPVTSRKVLSDRPQGSGVQLGLAVVGPMLSAGLFQSCLPVRKGGMGLQDPARVPGPAFQSSNFGFAGSQGELPDSFWSELSGAWWSILEKLPLSPEGTDSIDRDDIDKWTDQFHIALVDPPHPNARGAAKRGS